MFLNASQALASTLAAFAYVFTTKRGSRRSILGLPELASAQVDDDKYRLGHQQPRSATEVRGKTLALLRGYAGVALVATSASPFGLRALAHISYPTLLLGKSCKLVPVMLMSVILHRRSFATHKYIVVALVTCGIWAFMAFKDDGASGGGKKKGREASSLYGILLLSINLLLDGVTNASQDAMFQQFRGVIDGPSMMLWMNVFSSGYMLVALLLPSSMVPHGIVEADPQRAAAFSNGLSAALAFVATHRGIARDILLFSVCGALGQLFIFRTLALFGSLTLVTITVSRKMITMLLSVVVFHHALSKGQVAGVAAVFGGIGLEAYISRRDGIRKRQAAESVSTKSTPYLGANGHSTAVRRPSGAASPELPKTRRD